MSPLGSNQNNPLDDAVHSDIGTQFKWNQAAEKLLGWLAEKVMGFPIVETTRSVQGWQDAVTLEKEA
jgi:hypothetical protein